MDIQNILFVIDKVIICAGKLFENLMRDMYKHRLC